jgi:small subunit ribosomal protein S2
LEEIEATGMEGYSKKMASTLTREIRKMRRNLDGIRNMNRLPGAIVVLDVRREHIAIREANKLGIPTVCLIDTDSDPDTISIPIPGNDDSIRSVRLVVRYLGDAIKTGLEGRAVAEKEERPRRRSARAEYKTEPTEAVAEKPESAGGKPAAADATEEQKPVEAAQPVEAPQPAEHSAEPEPASVSEQSAEKPEEKSPAAETSAPQAETETQESASEEKNEQG